MGVDRKLVRQGVIPARSATSHFGLGLLLAACCNWASAGQIYKCPAGGSVKFTETPDGPGCQPVKVQVSEPNPADVARALERKEREKAEEEQAQREARERQQAELERRALLAREQEAAAADRRARAAEAEVRALQQQANPGYGSPYYPIIVPALPPGFGQGNPNPGFHPDHPQPPTPMPLPRTDGSTGGSTEAVIRDETGHFGRGRR